MNELSKLFYLLLCTSTASTLDDVKGTLPMPDHQAFKKAHEITTYFVNNSAQVKVEIQTPDLTKNAEHCWGDWGPMYSIELAEEQSIQISYHCAARDLHASYTVRPECVDLNSPAFAHEREKHPFYLEFADEERGLRFLAFFDQDAELQRTDIEVIHPEEDLDSLMFASATRQKLSA